MEFGDWRAFPPKCHNSAIGVKQGRKKRTTSSLKFIVGQWRIEGKGWKQKEKKQLKKRHKRKLAGNIIWNLKILRDNNTWQEDFLM